MFAKADPEPLAYRVQPRPDEAFDSWMVRLTGRHDMTRAQLYNHLGMTRRLATQDVARGPRGVPGSYAAVFGQLIDRLAWAVQCDRTKIEATFLDVSGDAILPPMQRRFGCVQCWREALEGGGPIIVRREWTLRASWWCHVHRLPLSDMRIIHDSSSARANAAALGRATEGMEQLHERLRPTRVMLAHNRRLLDSLLGGPPFVFRRGDGGYHERFVSNRFHLAKTRIVLLAAAHSQRSQAARRFETFVGLTTSSLATSGQGALGRRAKLCRKSFGNPADRGPPVTRVSRWELDLWSLLMAYAGMQDRLAPDRSLSWAVPAQS
ncbi:TniQ family protein [Sphingomonas sp. KC8]|uniref:TniQ family protein n=1 Tax=Sphingomonas sp. KC8 TaxID=1030157 RepID=UPI000248A788|nr:TniQ family protein [Sphingomonas sp. KC8]ARS28276.1 hypothetical protein KC8_13415 [Sphingomonas sp. KC8]